jgi:hypothetical protein
VQAESSLRKVGGLAAYGVAAAYLASGLSAVAMPPELQGRPDVTPHQFWLTLSAHPTAHLVFHWSYVAAGFCGIGAVPAISLLVWPVNPGAVLWTGVAAFFGFGVLARSHLMEVAFDRRIIRLYPDADASFQQAVHVVAGLALDVPDGFFTYGAIGVWVVTMSWLGLRHDRLPKGLCGLGFVAGLTYLAGVLAYTFGIRWLLIVAVGVGGLLVVPAWYAWVGHVLRSSTGLGPRA